MPDVRLPREQRVRWPEGELSNEPTVTGAIEEFAREQARSYEKPNETPKERPAP
ncbi:hypothetical protein ACOXVJ_01940 [Pseudomonas knackmussii]|uniref:hypothetical protein n=1 Tax=Pseudomonas knackmussii TaxID=65741 RepID=UPI001363F2FA|nr:hypothetical protein [Pseudomonas knackmussii]